MGGEEEQEDWFGKWSRYLLPVRGLVFVRSHGHLWPQADTTWDVTQVKQFSAIYSLPQLSD